jgi:ABC-type bacteriocin/lantibiotic exporter with double-glycine peptidase domain
MNNKNIELQRKMRSGKMLTALADIIAAVCFLVAYFGTDEILFLVMALVLFISCFAIYFVFSRLEDRFEKILNIPEANPEGKTEISTKSSTKPSTKASAENKDQKVI